MIRLFLAMLLATPLTHASSRCEDMASMYHIAYSLRDSGMTDKQLLAHTLFFSGFSDAERQRAIYRVKRDGELGFMSAKTLYQHVLLECRAGH